MPELRPAVDVRLSVRARAFGVGLAACAVALLVGCVSSSAGSIRATAPGVAAETSAAAVRQILVTIRQDRSLALQRAGSTPRPYGGTTRYKITPRARRTALRLARQYGLRQVDEWPIEALGVHCVVFELGGDTSKQEVLTALAGDSRVESVQPMQLFEVQGRGSGENQSYNDPYLHLQHSVGSMQVAAAHRWALGKGVKVAVVDSGVDLDHPELQGRIALVRDFVSDRRRAQTADLHGTAVAGVIASRPNNGIGIVGVAPDVHIIALKACWEVEGSASGARCSSFTLAKAIAFAVEERPDVLNLSLTGPPDPLLERLVTVAMERGTVVVAAASEAAGGGDRFASSLEGVLAVLSAGSEGVEAKAGTRGPSLVAPGQQILTTTPGEAFDFMSGSSFAAAHVSGIVALALELRPSLDASSLYRILEQTSVEARQPEGMPALMVNACAAIARLLPEANCSADPPSG